MSSPKVIASLTSYRKRISMVGLTIYSLLSQTYKLSSIELNLSIVNFPHLIDDLPLDIQQLEKKKCIFVNWLPYDNKPFKKLIPTLRKYYPQEYYILTVDDDFVYDNRYVASMVNCITSRNLDTFCPSTSFVIGNRMIYKSTIFSEEFVTKVIPPELVNTCVDDAYIYAYLRHINAKMGCNDPYIQSLIHEFNSVNPLHDFYIHDNRIQLANKLSNDIWS